LAAFVLFAESAWSAPAILTNSIPTLKRGQAASVQFVAIGGIPPYTFTLTPVSGSVPALNFTSGGAWSGTVPQTGSGQVTGIINVTVRDATHSQGSRPFTVTTIDPFVITMITDSMNFTQQQFSLNLSTRGGFFDPNDPASIPAWTETTPRPPGCSPLSSTGLTIVTPSPGTESRLFGLPAIGTWKVCLSVADRDTPATVLHMQLTLRVNPPPELQPLNDGAVNSTYNKSPVVLFGTNTSVSVASGALPPGLSISQFVNLVGIPTHAGTFSFTLRAEGGVATTRAYTIVIRPPITLVNPATPPTTVGRPLGPHTLQITGGTAPYIVTSVPSGLPAGVVMNGNVVSGTPTVSGDYSFPTSIEDAQGNFAVSVVQVKVNALPLPNVSASLPNATVGFPYALTFGANLGTPPYSFAIVSGQLPTGLSMNASAITGTPTSVTTESFQVRTTDSVGAVRNSLHWLQVVDPPTVSAQDAVLVTGVPASVDVSATGNFVLISFQGSMPPGMRGDVRRITGTPTTPGVYNIIVIATDTNGATASKAITITVRAPIQITTATLPDGIVNAAYPSTQILTNPVLNPTAWAITSGALPPGLTLNAATGVVSGIPTSTGMFPFTVTATPPAVTGEPPATKAFSLRVSAAPTPPAIQTTSLPAGVVNTDYLATLAVSGSSAPFVWSLQSGALPNGLALNASNGVISGKPAAPGVSNFTVKVTDTQSQSDSKALSIQVTAGCQITLNPSSMSAAFQGATTLVQVQTSGSGCAWTPSPNGAFLSVSDVNATSFRVTVAANPSATARSGAISVQGATFTVSQDGTALQSGLRFVALAPCRLVETRQEYNFQGRVGPFGPPFLARGSTRTLPLTQSNVCTVPSNAKAVVLNVTPIPKITLDFMTLWATGDAQPNVWSARSPDGQIVANSAIVKTGPNASINVFTSDDADLVIDINGYFTDDANVPRLVFYPVTPCRVIETRSDYRPQPGPFGPPQMAAQETRRFRFPSSPHCNIPAGAAAYSVGITVVPPGPLAFLTAWPAGPARPVVSNINSFAGRVLANNVIIPASPDGAIDVFTFDRSDFLMDIIGYFALDDGVNGMYYYPVAPCRALEASLLENESSRSVSIPSGGCGSIPANAKAYAMTVTALPLGPMPFVTAYPTGQPRPNSSVLNAFEGQIVTNFTITPAGTNAAIDLFAFRRTSLVVDVMGYFGR